MILVTGATGFIGSYLCEELYRRAYDFVATGKLPVKEYHAGVITRGNPHRRAPAYRWKYVRADLTKHHDVLRLPQADVIIHAAGLLMIDKHEPIDYFRVNTLGATHIADLAMRAGGSRIIFTQTHSDTNRIPLLKTGTERRYFFDKDTGDMKDNPIPFIVSKISAQETIEAYAREIGFPAITLRLSNIRGVGSRDLNVNSPFWQFIEKARRGESIEVWGERKTFRDFIYIRDVVSAIIAAINRPIETVTLNIGSGDALFIDDEVKAICEVFNPPGVRSEIVYRPDIPEVRKHSSLFDISEATVALDWKPKYHYRAALEDMKKIMEG